MMRFTSAAAAAALLGSAAAAQTAPAATDGKKISDKVICKSQPVMGSRLGTKRTCKTAQEWQDLRVQTRGTIEQSQRLWQKN